MRRPIAIMPLSLLLLGACHGGAGGTGKDDRDKTVHIAMNVADGADHVSLDIPGFDARLALPNIDLGKHMDLDGIRLAPDTAVHDVDVSGHDRDGGSGGEEGGGSVRIGFTSPRPPSALADYYRRSAGAAGYDAIAGSGGALTATKGGRHFALTAEPAGSGSKGTIVMSGSDG